MSDENQENAFDATLPEHSARMEGRIRAVEGILRSRKQSEQELQSGSRALRQLRGETVPMRTQRISNPAFKHTIAWLSATAASVVAGLLVSWWALATSTPPDRLAIADVQGEAIVELGIGTRKAETRTWIFPGERIVVRAGGSARLRFDDDSLLELAGDSALSLEPSRYGKFVKLSQGQCRFSVKPQPDGETLTIQTPSASVNVLGTTLAVAARGVETEVDVESGKVKFAHSMDGSVVQIQAGQSAVAKAGRTLAARQNTFVLGVNLGGRSVVIDGDRWLSYREALSSGLSHGALSVWDHKNFKLRQPEDPDLTAMLQSGVWTNENHRDDPLVLRQSLPNGEYKIYIWSIENAFNYMRRLTLSLNGDRVATGIACVPYGDWAKCGPYTARVTNGVLEMEIGRLNGNGGERHINGYAIYRVGE